MVDLNVLPKEPGCYLFRSSVGRKGKVLYVGKAKNIKKRVSSYFQKKDHDAKTAALVSHIVSVDFIVTDTEAEALLLENNLIKKYKPKYNIDLKDSRRYAYIHLTDEKFPRLVTVRKIVSGGEFFGPFVSGAHREYLISLLTKTFKIRTCRRLPKRSCLREHLGLCDAPCVGGVSEEEYNLCVDHVRMILKGRTVGLKKMLRGEMKKSADALRYEQALVCRRQLEAIEWLEEKQRVQRDKKYDEDVIGYRVADGVVFLLVFNVHKGILLNKQEFEFSFYEGFFEDFLIRYYDEHEVPKEVVICDKGVVSDELVAYLSDRKGSAVGLIVPKKGDKKHLLDLVMKNIELTFFGDLERLEELRKGLKLQELPRVIECFDISHLSGTSTVASMVQFRNGRADKSSYRRFKIRGVDGIDDFASMKEVVSRRYKRLLAEGSGLPDLIVIDGGKGQLSVAVGVLRELGLRLPVIALAKKLEEIFVPGLRFSIRLDKKNKGLQLLRAIRDEAHRFAISYNRLLRGKKIRE